MGTTTEKLTYLQGTKDAIKNAIVAKGVEVPEGTTFRGYAEKVGEIQTEITPEWKTTSVSWEKEGKMYKYKIKIPIESKNQSVIIFLIDNYRGDEQITCFGISTETISDAVYDYFFNADNYFKFMERTNEMVTFEYAEQFKPGDKVFTYIIV